MKINKPEIYKVENRTIFQVKIESKLDIPNLWYSIDDSYSSFLSESCDAPLVALLIPAMEMGEDIYISGVSSEKLFFNLSGVYQHILKKIIPTLQFVNIYPDELSDVYNESRGIATGFSGGVDSFCVLADHFYKDNIPQGFKVTHLLLNNVGAYTKGGNQLFNEKYKKVKKVSEKIGLPLINIDSNLADFYQNLFSFGQTHTPRNASVAHLLQNGIKRWLYASAFDYEKIFIGESPFMGYSDSITLPLLSSESLDALSIGSQYTRVEKTLLVAENPDSFDNLDVCVNFKSTRNCSTCEKCMRTLLTLDIAGVINRYSASFDLEKYYSLRESYIATLLKSKKPYAREIKDFAKERKFFLKPRFFDQIKSIRYRNRLFVTIIRKLRRIIMWIKIRIKIN